MFLTMLLVVAPHVHAADATTASASIPSTTAYFFSSHPMISGTVATVNDHQLVIDTEQGERITLVVDTRTMAPRDLAPGMTVRTEFAALENCRFHADRVIPVRTGMPNQRLQAYANTRERGEMLGYNASYRHDTRVTSAPGMVMKAVPGSADYGYSTRPLLSGTALTVSDHRLVVETDQGRRVAMVMDSRTLVPRELAPGSMVRAEFKEMNDGRFYAQRVSVLGSNAESREQAYAYTQDADVAAAGVIGDCESVTATPGSKVSSSTDGSSGNGSTMAASNDASPSSPNANRSADEQQRSPSDDAVAQNNSDSGTDSTPLPDTASRRPWLLLFGLVALGTAGAIAVVRRVTAA